MTVSRFARWPVGSVMSFVSVEPIFLLDYLAVVTNQKPATRYSQPETQ